MSAHGAAVSPWSETTVDFRTLNQLCSRLISISVYRPFRFLKVFDRYKAVSLFLKTFFGLSRRHNVLFQDKQQHRRRHSARARSRSDKAPWARTQCKAPRLENRQIMEEHDTTNSGSKKSEFLDLWMDQLEETTRQEKVEEF